MLYKLVVIVVVVLTLKTRQGLETRNGKGFITDQGERKQRLAISADTFTTSSRLSKQGASLSVFILSLSATAFFCIRASKLPVCAFPR